MKKITFLLCFLIATSGFAQVVLEDFEGPAPTLAIDNENAGTSVAIVADPDPTPMNGNVLRFITGAAGLPWQQAELTLQGDYLDLTADKTMTVDVYSETAFDILIRVTDGVVSSSDGTAVPDSAADGIHTGTGWETVTFDFSMGETQDGQAVANGIYGKLFFFNLWDANDSGTGPGAWTCNDSGNCASVTAFYDNITGVAGGVPETCSDGILNNGEEEIDCGGVNCAPCPELPTVAAPTPVPRAPQNVISIYSDAYNSIALESLQSETNANVSEVQIEGNNTIQLDFASGGTFTVIGFNEDVDATEMTRVHMDIYIVDVQEPGDVWLPKFSNWYGTQPGETNALETTIIGGLPQDGGQLDYNTWEPIDLPWSAFMGIAGEFFNAGQAEATANGETLTSSDRSRLRQLVLANSGTTNLVYVDNIYLHNNNLSTDEFSTSNFKVYPNPTKNVWNVESNTIIRSVVIYDILGKQVSASTPNATDVAISSTNIKTGIYFAKIEGDNGIKTIKLIKE